MNFVLIFFVLLIVIGVFYVVDVLKFCKYCLKNVLELVWVEWGVSFFLVILIVFVFCFFLFELFKILFGLMILIFLVGDFIFVNKFIYGICLLVINKKIIDINELWCGDVMVFCYLEDLLLDYIKCVVGLLGDIVVYQNKCLIINGQLVEMIKIVDYLYLECFYYLEQYFVKMGNV